MAITRHERKGPPARGMDLTGAIDGSEAAYLCSANVALSLLIPFGRSLWSVVRPPSIITLTRARTKPYWMPAVPVSLLRVRLEKAAEGFLSGAVCDSSSGCGQTRREAGWRRLPARQSAIHPI